MLRITGYSDKYSVCPGDNLKFYINSEQSEDYELQMVRLIHGDTNPDGPGYKEDEIADQISKTIFKELDIEPDYQDEDEK